MHLQLAGDYDYYNYNKSGMFVLLLDASKAFDNINYCKFFTDLLKPDVSPLVLRLLLHMYTNQTLCVKWRYALSNLFSVKMVSNKVVCSLRFCLQFTQMVC